MLQDRFVNHQFDRVYSGLYYQIKPAGAGEPGGQISRSLFDQADRVTGHGAARRAHLGLCRRARKSASARAVAADRISHRRHARPATTAAPIPSLVAGDLAEVDAESAAFNGTLIWSFLLLGLGLVAAIFLQVRVGLLPLRRLKRGAGAHPRRQGAAAGRRISRRDRAAGHRTQFPDRAQRRSGGPRPHPCLQSGAFPQDAAQRAGQRSRRRAAARWPTRSSARSTPCAARWIIISPAPAPPAASMCWATARRWRRCWTIWRAC